MSPDARCEADDHCITCGDVAVPMRVVRTDASDRLAWCREDGSEAGGWVDVELVGDVAVPMRVVRTDARDRLAGCR